MKDQLWIVGHVTDLPTGAWEFQGVFSSEADAIKECRTEQYFIGLATLDKPLPHERTEWPGAYYPKV